MLRGKTKWILIAIALVLTVALAVFGLSVTRSSKSSKPATPEETEHLQNLITNSFDQAVKS